MIVSWGSRYPDPRILKTETACMAEAFTEVLLEEIPNSEIEGIYCKGSAVKDWDSPLDYVPEMSDVDIHILFRDDSAEDRYLGSVGQAVHVQARVEERYFSKVPQPLHVPRPQLLVLNRLLLSEDYVPSPRSTVAVLYGKDAPDPDYGDGDRIRRTDCRRLLAEADFLKQLPHQAVDRLAGYIRECLRPMSWRVSPAGPRVLHILGLPTEKAWSINRTEAFTLLKEMDQEQLGRDYADYYLHAWEFYLSGYADGSAGRSSLTAGARVLGRGGEIAESWLGTHPAAEDARG